MLFNPFRAEPSIVDMDPSDRLLLFDEAVISLRVMFGVEPVFGIWVLETIEQ